MGQAPPPPPRAVGAEREASQKRGLQGWGRHPSERELQGHWGMQAWCRTENAGLGRAGGSGADPAEQQCGRGMSEPLLQTES